MTVKLVAPFRFCVDAVHVLAMKDSHPNAVQIFWCWLAFRLAKIRFKLTRKSAKTPHRMRLAGHTINGPLYDDLWEMFSEVFLSQIYWVPLPERPKIIDCGSNVGCATLYFKLLAPSASIICFEPSPVTFSYLKQNVDKNKFANVSLVQAACGKENGIITFLIDPTHSTGSTVKEIWECEMERREVTQVRLSDFIDETIDLLKLDVEGAECDVLEDLERANKLAFVQRMIIEFHHNLNPSQSNMGSFLAILERAGFVYTIDVSCSRAHRFASGWQGVMLYVWRPSVLSDHARRC